MPGLSRPPARCGVCVLIDHLIYAHPDLDTAVATLHRQFGVEAALAVDDIEAAASTRALTGSTPVR